MVINADFALQTTSATPGSIARSQVLLQMGVNLMEGENMLFVREKTNIPRLERLGWSRL
jgi:hypothetical protein